MYEALAKRSNDRLSMFMHRVEMNENHITPDLFGVIDEATKKYPHSNDDLCTAHAAMNQDRADSEKLRLTVSTRRASYHAAMKKKYQAAAIRPWIAVQPDPIPR
jgi:hypothetical protein